jgi:hypothetical protein
MTPINLRRDQHRMLTSAVLETAYIPSGADGWKAEMLDTKTIEPSCITTAAVRVIERGFAEAECRAGGWVLSWSSKADL